MKTYYCCECAKADRNEGVSLCSVRKEYVTPWTRVYEQNGVTCFEPKAEPTQEVQHKGDRNARKDD